MNRPEEWKPVVGWSDYMVSDQGRVMSRKGRTQRILSAFLNGRGSYPYPSVTLRQPGMKQVRAVHILVAEAFIGPRPEGLEVRHLDGDPMNPQASNLRFGTRSENMQDRVLHGRHPMQVAAALRRAAA